MFRRKSKISEQPVDTNFLPWTPVRFDVFLRKFRFNKQTKECSVFCASADRSFGQCINALLFAIWSSTCLPQNPYVNRFTAFCLCVQSILKARNLIILLNNCNKVASRKKQEISFTWLTEHRTRLLLLVTQMCYIGLGALTMV